METYVAVFDIGTAAIKGMLLDKHASITGEYTVLLNTYHGENGEIEQNTIDWWTKVKEIANKWWTKIQIDPKQVEVITFSGQMEDVIPISEKHPNQRAILYLDTRADQEATIINEKLPTIHKNRKHCSFFYTACQTALV